MLVPLERNKARTKFAGALIENASCQDTGVQFPIGGVYPIPSRSTASATLTIGKVTLNLPLILIPFSDTLLSYPWVRHRVKNIR